MTVDSYAVMDDEIAALLYAGLEYIRGIKGFIRHILCSE